MLDRGKSSVRTTTRTKRHELLKRCTRIGSFVKGIERLFRHLSELKPQGGPPSTLIDYLHLNDSIDVFFDEIHVMNGPVKGMLIRKP